MEAAEGEGRGEAAEREEGVMCMEEYLHPTTQAGEPASPVWLCCTGRSSAAPEALHPPLTVSIYIESLNLFYVTVSE